MSDSIFFAAFDVLIKILESYRPQIPSVVLLVLSLFTFISFDGVTTFQISQRYSSFVIFMKCTKTSEDFLYFEELVAVAFVETHVDALFDLI